MSGNDSETLKQLAPVSNVVSSPGGGGIKDTLTNGGIVSGVVYRDLFFRSDDANSTPTTGYGDVSVATDITEGDLDDGSVIFAGGGAGRGLVRDKEGRVIRTCGIAGCQYRGRADHMKNHKAAKHGIDVVWFSCDQVGCDYKAKQASDLKQHKQNVHSIDVRWLHCSSDGCKYKTKQAGNLNRHKQQAHGIDVGTTVDTVNTRQS